MGAKERYDKRDPEFREDDHIYYAFYRDWILPRIKGPYVLDVGCGQGWLTKEIAGLERVEKIVAVDKFGEQPDENLDDKIVYIQHVLPGWESDSRFTTVVSTEFLEHIVFEDQLKMLKFIKEHMVTDGVFLGSMPDVYGSSGNPFHLAEWNQPQWKLIMDDFFGEIEQHPGPGSIQVWKATKPL